MSSFIQFAFYLFGYIYLRIGAKNSIVFSLVHLESPPSPANNKDNINGICM